MVQDGNRLVGSTISRIGFSADHVEEEDAEAVPVPEEAEANAVAAAESPADNNSLLEYDVGAHPLGINIIPSRPKKSRTRSLTEASDVMYIVTKLAAADVGISPEDLNGRVNARLRVDRRKHGWFGRLVRGDEKAWANRI